jgi:hypothetical protein
MREVGLQRGQDGRLGQPGKVAIERVTTSLGLVFSAVARKLTKPVASEFTELRGTAWRRPVTWGKFLVGVESGRDSS